jgi:AraC family transcriptional regulator
MHDLSFPQQAHTILTSQGRGWRGLEAEFRRIPAGPTKVAAAPSHRLGVHYGPSVNAACRCDGRIQRRVQSHGDADFVPAGFDGEWEDDSDCSILRLSVSVALFRQAAADMDIDPDRLVFSPRLQLRDDGIQHIAWALKGELEANVPSDRLYADSLGLALAARLVALQADRPAPPSNRRTLSAPQRRRAIAFIEANLDQSLSLADIAAAAGTGVSQLKALFPGAFGMPVHQYVIRRRVERAKCLLLAGELPISQVALAAGFAHQSHMAQCMKRILGAAPREIAAMRL